MKQLQCFRSMHICSERARVSMIAGGDSGVPMNYDSAHARALEGG